MKNRIIMSLCGLFILGFFIVVFLTMCETKKENKTIDEMLIAETRTIVEETSATTATTTVTTSTTKSESYTTKKVEISTKKILTNDIVEKTSSKTPSTSAAATKINNNNNNNNNVYYSKQDIIDIAKVMQKECGGVPSKTEQACVVWTVLNRVDKYNSSVYSVVRAKNQFAFYENSNYTTALYNLAEDVLSRWSREKQGETNIGRALPPEYLYFYGDGQHNYFYTQSGQYWNYSLSTPYNS